MKTKLAKQNYLILMIGLLILGFLFSFTGYQLVDILEKNAHHKPKYTNLVRLLGDTKQPLNKLRHSLEMTSGIKVRPLNEDRDAQYRRLSVNEIEHLKFPEGWREPFVVKYNNSEIVISFSYVNKAYIIACVCIFILVLLVIAGFLLCYFIISRLEKANLLAKEAIKQLSENINNQIALPVEHEDIAEIYNDIQKIQNNMQQILQKRTRMLAAISHDLKTPITRLKLRIELSPNISNKEQLLGDIAELEEMLSSILLFSKSFLQEENTVKFNISELVDSVCEDLIDIGNKLSVDVEQNILYRGKMMGIKRAISNTLDNAIKYGQKDVKIKLYQNDEKNSLICEISDKGEGVDISLYESLFEPFYRVDQSRNNNVIGSGLGLSISKEIIEGHGGSIKLLPSKPCGLTAQISLPL